MGLINFGGIATGVDTNALVEQLLAVERLPQVRLKQRQELLKTREDVLRDASSRLLNLKTAAKALGDALLFAKVSAVTSSDATAITATASGTAVAGAYTVSVTQLARNEVKTQGSAITQAAADDTLSFSIDGGPARTFSIAAGASLSSIAASINSATIGVNAAVVDGKLRLDAAGVLAVADGDTANGYDLAADLAFATTQTHQQSQFTVNGTAYARATNTVGDAIAGVSFTLLKQASSTLTVSQPAIDAAKIKTKVQEFVTQYNSTYSFLRDKVNEAKVVPPKTTSDQLKGALKGDRDLTTTMRDLRRALADAVGGLAADADELAEIGIGTGSSSGVLSTSANDGLLVLDNAKLDKALAERPQGVQDLLQRAGAGYSDHGLVRRISDVVDPLTQVGGLLGMRTDGYAAERKRMDDRIAQLERQLVLREQRWRAQFTAMERLVAGYQKAGSLFGGGA